MRRIVLLLFCMVFLTVRPCAAERLRFIDFPNFSPISLLMELRMNEIATELGEEPGKRLRYLLGDVW